MAVERTLAIIKPDALQSGKAGKILAHLERAGFAVTSMKLTVLSRAQASAFYVVHAGQPFYEELVEFMTSGPVIPMVLEADDAVANLREEIGATDPAEAGNASASSSPTPRPGRIRRKPT